MTPRKHTTILLIAIVLTATGLTSNSCSRRKQQLGPLESYLITGELAYAHAKAGKTKEETLAEITRLYQSARR